MVLRAQGTATAEGLRQAKELGFVSRAGQGRQRQRRLRRWRCRSARGVPEISLTSNLQGLALNLPPPLAKTAEAVLPLRYENVAGA